MVRSLEHCVAKSRCGAVMLQSQMQVYVPSMLKSWGGKKWENGFS